MLRVKICGVTNVRDAQIAVEAGADAIGLNFYPDSPRHCTMDLARQIVAAMPRSVCKVGVFVNASAQEIRAAVDSLGLDLIQLHGDEPPGVLQAIRPLPVMRAFRVADDLSAVTEYLQACHHLRCTPRMLLVDAQRPGQFGGTGATLDWSAMGSARPHFGGVPLVLAGGLKPDNVAAAIAAARPWAVDTASGVESSPGKKSESLVREFVAAAKAAFARAIARR